MHWARWKRGGSTNLRRRQHESHGMSYSREYRIWHSMIQRCTNPRAENYSDYGGRGILVCTEWLQSFRQFYTDMGNCPDELTLDRVDNNGNYEKANCRWSSRSEQSLNQRLRSDNRCGYRGVREHKSGIKRWQAYVFRDGVQKSLGYYRTAKEASDARADFDSATIRDEIVQRKTKKS